MQNPFYDHLEKIKVRIGMYVGDVSLKSLDAYISGYLMALSDLNFAQEQPNFRDFHEFVRAKYNYFELTAGWANMITAVVLGYKPENIVWADVFAETMTFEQHQQSIALFYELLEEFKESKVN